MLQAAELEYAVKLARAARRRCRTLAECETSSSGVRTLAARIEAEQRQRLYARVWRMLGPSHRHLASMVTDLLLGL